MATERRKNLRLGLAIPLRVQGFLGDGGNWEEMSSTVDVSAGGASFGVSHEVELGQVLLLSLGLPKRLRQFDLNDASYRVYSLVRSVRRRPDQPRVGVMFFGKYPPRGFNERPAARYLLPTDQVLSEPAPDLRSGDTGPLSALLGVPPPGAPPDPAPSPMPPPPAPAASPSPFLPTDEVPEDRRAAPRVELFVNFTLQQVDEWGAVLQEELTVADNVGPGGARVMSSLGYQVGDVVLLQEPGGGFATRAEIRAITQAQPTIERLHLRFIDRQAPERLLRQ
jgi:hypothetical protein